jgi:hypothetical protein
MITAEKIKKLSNLTSSGLNQALSNAGYTMFEKVLDREFVGITNGGQFCYKFTYKEASEGTLETGKLFVSINETGLAVADY